MDRPPNAARAFMLLYLLIGMPDLQEIRSYNHNREFQIISRYLEPEKYYEVAFFVYYKLSGCGCQFFGDSNLAGHHPRGIQ